MREALLLSAIAPWVTRLCGGDLEGHTVLDVGCHTGSVGLELARRGATVTGVDAREEHIATARERASEEALDCRFEVCDAFEIERVAVAAQFDVVLVLGLLYHTGDPIGLMKALSRHCATALVLDSHVHFDSDAQREAVPSWQMLADSDWSTPAGMVAGDPRGKEALLEAERIRRVPYERSGGGFEPPPHLAREVEVVEAFAEGDEDAIPESKTSVPPAAPVLVPNRAAVRDLLRAIGFPHVAELAPLRFAPRPYLLKHRAAFVALRDEDAASA